ncbi:AlpA family transcriptional regulator [Poseidonocella sp. HB161398]|uniref:helix-turn-helix transcriptional regulator n=1 Tax=Poseidonocella sp. HB161398 TaxID=2320855 RepID=UPI0011092DD0|nr:transcriptional regulator [Poseidonocella sp. HB161398]
MAERKPIFGDRPPAYPGKATLAAELDMSESTVDSYVKRGLLPPPVMRGGAVRWCWAEVVSYLDAGAKGADGEDPFMTGINNV